MNIEVFVGSPRNNGNTATIAKMFIRAAGESDWKCTEHFFV